MSLSAEEEGTSASSRESVFGRCARSEVDPHFPKYPRLPVLACAGYERPEDEGDA